MNDTALADKILSQAYRSYPRWYRELNSNARELDSKMEWPDARQEAWRRSQIKRLDLENLYKREADYPNVSTSGGRQFQVPHGNQKNLRLASLDEAIQGDFPGVRELLETQMDRVENRFQARLLAQSPKGFYLYLPRDYRATGLLFLEDRVDLSSSCSCGSTGDCGSNCNCDSKCDSQCSCKVDEQTSDHETFTMNLVVLEDGAKADLWERISQSPEESLLHNRSTLILLKQGAQLNYQRTQNLAPHSTMVDFSLAALGEGAQLNAFQAELGINFNKSHLDVLLEGRRAKAELKGIYQLKNKQFTELFTLQDHRSPKCTSHSLYRGVLQDSSRSVYNGMIKVEPHAVDTDAYLTNNNLLLNDGCRADSIPGLKIENNEVRCSHGSTTGKMDEDQLFYLTARGLSREQARRLMTHAFLEELTQDCSDLVRKEINLLWGLDED